MVLLDSSAWLAHIFGESGVEEVNQLFEQDGAEICISVLSIPEVYARINALGRSDQWPLLWGTYSALFTRILAVDEEIAHHSVILRAASPRRLPTIDALIAATAAIRGLILVHRDPHIVTIPDQLLSQKRLPSK